MPEFLEVEGLDGLRRALRKVDRDASRELTKDLKLVGQPVVVLARSIAEEKGLHETGALINRINISVRGGTIYVRDTAKRKSRKYPSGYPYPSVYEFGGRGSDVLGPRAFVAPAVTEAQPDVLREWEEIIGNFFERTFV
jgi:hypothetical protein